MDGRMINWCWGKRPHPGDSFGVATESRWHGVHRFLYGGLLVLLCAFSLGCSSGDAEISLDIPAELGSEVAAATTETPAGGTEATESVTKRKKTLLNLEKDELKFGFIKLTDCAPIVIAREKGFFEAEGLQVEVIAQPNWKTLLDNVINGELDGAHMLSGQPIAATIGFGTKAHVITAFTMDLNGNGITVSNSVWEQMQQHDEALKSPTPKHPISATALKPVVQSKLQSGEKLQMGMVFPVSTHNYELRYWLPHEVGYRRSDRCRG